MSKVLAIANHKGGVGKTTSAVNIGAGLSKLGKQVLLVDLDPQANLTQSLNIKHPTANVYSSMSGNKPLQTVNICKRLDAVPSTLELAGVEVNLDNRDGWEFTLKKLLEPISGDYDYIIIDSPPSLGLLTVNALTSANELLIPIQAQYLALQGLTKLLEVVERIQRELNKGLRIGGVFITQYDSRKILNRNIAEAVREHFKDTVFKTSIRDNIALAEAPTRGEDIYRYSPDSYGARDYLALCREILKR